MHFFGAETPEKRGIKASAQRCWADVRDLVRALSDISADNRAIWRPTK